MTLKHKYICCNTYVFSFMIRLFLFLVFVPTVAISKIDPLSLSSYFIEVLNKNNIIGTATGFVIETNNRYYLVTNWHVVTGKHPSTKKHLMTKKPEKFVIHLPVKSSKDNRLIWVKHREPLYGKDSIPLWYEHPSRNNVDVILLPLTKIDSTKDIKPINFELEKADVLMRVGMNAVIIGFPRGLSASGKLPIWKTGHLASEPYLDYNNKPAILIDVRTIGGMSGSPAFIRTYGYVLKKSTQGYHIGKTGTLFVGIYSARMRIAVEDKSTKSDLGLIWKPRVIHEILDTIKK